jgi:hypothetical protein
MKTITFVHTAFIWVVTAILATGTPDHEVKVKERLLGSNSEGFITLRTEVDNLGSYYNFRTRRFLVEYAKLPEDPTYEESLGAEVKSQLLLDVSTSLGVNQSAPNPAEAKSEETIAKNEDVKLAELLLRFPDDAKRWDNEKFHKLTYDSTNGPRLDRIGIAWGGWIKERFGGDRNADLKWELNEVFEDANCLYLSVYSESYGQRLVSIPPRKTQQVRDQLAKQPVYLIAGKFKNAEEAVKKGRELMEKTQGKFKPEIWSTGRWKEEMIYVVADSQSEEHINDNTFETLEALTGVDFTVMSSQSFDERTAVAPSK